jgi:hypothetical protein
MIRLHWTPKIIYAGASVALGLVLAVSIAIAVRTTAGPLPKNELTETIVAIGEARKSNRGVAITVTHDVQKTLTTRNLSMLFGWISELYGQEIVPRTGPETHYIGLMPHVLSKHSNNFCPGDDLVLSYKAIEGGQFILEEAAVVNRNKFCGAPRS